MMAPRAAIWMFVISLLLTVASVECYNGVSKRTSKNRVRYHCEVFFLGSSETSVERIRPKVWVGTYDDEALAALACDVVFYYTNRLSDFNLVHSEEAILRYCKPRSSYENLNNWDERKEFIKAQANALVMAIQSDLQWPEDMVLIQSEAIAERVVAHFMTRPGGPLQEFIAFMAWFLDPSNEQQILELLHHILGSALPFIFDLLETKRTCGDTNDASASEYDRTRTGQKWRQSRLQIGTKRQKVNQPFIPFLTEPGFLGHSVARSLEDERKQVWIKLQALRKEYLVDMLELYGLLTARSLQPMPAEQLQKFKHYIDVLRRLIPYLRVPQDCVPKEFNIDKVHAFEKQIVEIMEIFKRRRQGAA